MIQRATYSGYNPRARSAYTINNKVLTPDLLRLDGALPLTMFDTAIGGSNSAPNGKVKRWEDVAGANRNVTNATPATSRPTRLQGIKNGLDALNLTGYTDIYMQNLTGFGTLTGQTVVLVFSFTSRGVSAGRVFSQQTIAGSDNTQTGHFIPFLQAGNSTQVCGAYADGGYRCTGTVSNGWHVAVITHTGAQIEVFLDGVSFGTYAHTWNGTWGIFSIGGAETQTGEVRVYSRALTDVEVAAETFALKAKWAI